MNRRESIKAAAASVIGAAASSSIDASSGCDQLLVGGPANGWLRIGMEEATIVAIPIRQPAGVQMKWLPEQESLPNKPLVSSAVYVATDQFRDGARVFEFDGIH